MKIGVGQINTRVGDFEGNAQKILEACEKFAKDGADFAVFPELALSGCPLKDLVFYEKFVDEANNALNNLVKKLPLPTIIGCPTFSKNSKEASNSAYWIEDGNIFDCYNKMLLPNYGALNEPRNFSSGENFGLIEFKGKKIGITICEDIWSLPSISTSTRYKDSPQPLNYYCALKDELPIDLLINLSASVFSSTNDNVRKKGGMLCQVSEYVDAPILWCNLVGGNDALVFAGGSAYVDARKGREAKSLCLPKFEESLQVIDTEAVSGYDGDAHDFNGDDDLQKALTLALGDFVNKCGIPKVLIGLSGGIDSALVAALAVEALGKDRVIGVSMPSKISSQHSKDDARDLAKNLGIEFHTVSIADVVESAETSLAPIFAGRVRDVTEENIQSRSRGLILMAISNKLGAVVLTTGNKSECAVGYCTLYGDTCGGFAPICDVYKTEVFRLSKLINQKAGREIIPQNTIDKPPSAELRPDQKDEDSLPPYDLFDAILRLHIDEYLSVSEIVERGFDEAVVRDVARKVAGAEYKRTQYPIGPKVSKVAYSTDRIIPVAIRRGIQ